MSVAPAAHLAPPGSASGSDDDGGEEAGGGCRIPVPPALHAAMSEDDRANLRVEHGFDDSVVLSVARMR